MDKSREKTIFLDVHLLFYQVPCVLMLIKHPCSLLTSALTSSINVNTLQPIEALLNYLLCP